MLRHVAARKECYFKREATDDGGKKRHLCKVYPGSPLAVVLSATKDLLSEVTLPKAIMGGRKGFRPRDFLEPHIRRPVVLEIDLKNFFPSVSSAHVRSLFRDDLGCSIPVANLLADLTTVDAKLPLGFHASTHIGNLILRHAVWDLQRLAQKHRAVVTVWVDNIAISGPAHIAKLAPVMVRILKGNHVTPHDPESMHAWQPQTICHVTVNSGLSWAAERRRPFERQIHQLERGETPEGYDTMKEAMEKLPQRAAGLKSMVPRQSRRWGRQIERAIAQSPSLVGACDVKSEDVQK